MANNQQRKLYIVSLVEEISEFKDYHRGYGNPYTPTNTVQKYVEAMVEQMVAHFHMQNIAVQMFVGHYADLIANNASPAWAYHPLRFLRPNLTPEEYRGYLQCLYGFAERVYRAIEAIGLWGTSGVLLASFQHIEFDTLYLIERPEVPSAIFS